VDARVATACAELFATPDAGARRPDGDVVVVSHVTPIKAAVAWALGADAGLSWRLHLQTASVTRIGWGHDAPVLHGFNQVAPGRDSTPQSAGA
jgi:broad specificity phosphatase PhoE